MTAEIRPGIVADDPALQALDEATWSWMSSPSALRPGLKVIGRSGEEVLVAELEGAVSGYISFGPALPVDSNSHVIQIRGLAVDPVQQGRGVGRLLLETLARTMAERGARRLTLRVLATNLGARALYEGCGFIQEGVLRDEFLLEGDYVDDVLMALDLTTAEMTA